MPRLWPRALLVVSSDGVRGGRSGPQLTGTAPTGPPTPNVRVVKGAEKLGRRLWSQ